MTNAYTSRGKYFEEFEIGLEIESQGRTITEADLVNFSGVSGDYNPIHTDAEFSKATPFGERIAHGMLVLSVATGLGMQLGFLDGTVIAFTGLEWKFRGVVKIGDTVRMIVKVAKAKAMKAAGGGFVVFDARVLNQRNEVVQQGEWTVLVKSKG
ncbi:3-hydroxybutyryl-CoA dehydratase [Anaerolineae bacterium]|nr:3-hydroxybutyryl-CoA dehydratase [Anaerolineae bacterium]